MSSYDIKMSLDDTLELDTLIKKSSEANEPVTDNNNEFNISGIQTHTSILDPKSSGTYTITVNSQELKIKVTDPNIIPDRNIYLHDDWNDNKIQNRDGSGTTTYNNVQGIYRPEWSIVNGTPSAKNKKLVMDNGDEIKTSMNVNTNYKITWRFDLTCPTPSSGRMGINILSNGSTAYGVSEDIYGDLYLYDVANSQRIIQSNINNDGSTKTIKLTRTPSGDWELFYGGSSVGSASSTSIASFDGVNFKNNTNNTGYVDNFKCI